MENKALLLLFFSFLLQMLPLTMDFDETKLAAPLRRTRISSSHKLPPSPCYVSDFRCAEPTAEGIFSNFTLLLTEDPVEDERDEINMGVIYGDETAKSAAAARVNDDEMEDDEKLIDEDDKLHFPAEEKEIDISKHIRDLVHVEITINAICDANCKGLCLKCGANLNKESCNCSQKVEEEATECGAFRNLRKQMQQR